MIRLTLVAIFGVLVIIAVVLIVFHPDVLDRFTRAGADRRMRVAQVRPASPPASWSVTVTRHVPDRPRQIGRVIEVGERKELR